MSSLFLLLGRAILGRTLYGIPPMFCQCCRGMCDVSRSSVRRFQNWSNVSYAACTMTPHILHARRPSLALMKIPVPRLLEAVCDLDSLEAHLSRVFKEITLFLKLVRHHLANEHPF